MLVTEEEIVTDASFLQRENAWLPITEEEIVADVSEVQP